MKGMYARFQQRQAKKIFPAAMEVYAETLNHLTQASGGGGVLRQDDRPLNIRLKPNEVYAVRALDRPDYYRTVMIKKNQMNGQFQMLISNPVYGTTPPGIDEVSQEQVFKQMREMNAQMIQGKDFDAFPLFPCCFQGPFACTPAVGTDPHLNLFARSPRREAGPADKGFSSTLPDGLNNYE